MTCKEKPYSVGDMVRVRFVTSHPLPDGLPAGALVKVLEMDTGRRDVEYQGKRFSLPMVNVFAGMLYEVEGKWLEANHPAVLRKKDEWEAMKKEPNEPAARSAVEKYFD
jgi:hypothetical protein